jgi:ABC-2 type transport system permease protein
MATIAATAPRGVKTASPGIWLPAYSLWLREIVRFYRQKARVAGVIASPLIFWVVLGAGFAHSFNAGSGTSAHYLGYFFPGSVAMIVLFTAIFSMMSLIQDRNEGFLLSVRAAPVSRS